MPDVWSDAASAARAGDWTLVRLSAAATQIGHGVTIVMNRSRPASTLGRFDMLM